jgi:prophage tail gpP-like protein
MSLANGQSEIDTVVLRLPDYGKEIRNWSQYQFDQQFLLPTSSWSFRVSDEDTTLTSELLVPGARVELVINDRVQCSGFIDRKDVDGDAGAGTTVTVHGRDILGRVVDATIDPFFKFTPGMSIVDVTLAVLRPFGITTVYNSDVYNINVITGYAKGTAGGAATTRVKVQVPKRTTNADGTVTLSYDTVDGFVVNDATRPDLHKIQVEQVKPHAGEGVYAYIERLARRLGLTLWAAADASGVVLDKADFTSAAQQSIVHKRTDTSRNNLLRGSVSIDLSTQPSCIVAFGFGGGKQIEKTSLKIIMINELTGLDDSGQPLPEIQNIMARYKSAKVLPIRKELVPFRRPLGDQKIAAPFFLKDDESKNLAQLEAFTRREMANRQQKALAASYDVVGHTQGGHPWGVNTKVSVDDDVRGVHEDLWVLGKTFTKSSGGGTRTSLRLIRPYTLQIAQ